MPTTYTDQFFVIDPYAPPPVGTMLISVPFTLIDQNDDGDVDRFDGDSIDGQDVTSSYPGDTVTITLAGGGSVTYVGTTFYLADGRQVFTPTDGQVLQNGEFGSASAVTNQGPLDVEELGPPCFVTGTLIQTPDGRRPIEDICVGDLVDTVDHGPQIVRWVGARSIRGQGDFAPIRFAQGVVGNDRPMYLSPQHRVLVDGWRAELMFGEREVIVAAKHLINDRSIRAVSMREVTYHHFLFDQHELVWADGCVSESFFPGDTILAEDAALHREITTLFPELHDLSDDVQIKTARPVIRAFEARAMLAA